MHLTCWNAQNIKQSISLISSISSWFSRSNILGSILGQGFSLDHAQNVVRRYSSIPSSFALIKPPLSFFYLNCLLARFPKVGLGRTNERLCCPVSVSHSSLPVVVTEKRKLSMPNPIVCLEFVKECWRTSFTLDI